MYYYLSIGTNVKPEINAVKIINQLILSFGDVIIFPFVRTEAENILTKHYFLNSIAVIKSKVSNEVLKGKLNSIEVDLGRDRSDPESSIKDRVADIDILLNSTTIEISILSSSTEGYVQTVLNDKDKRVDLSSFGLAVKDGPASVNLEMTTGDILILNDTVDCLVNR